MEQSIGHFTCNATRPLGLRMRSDLITKQHQYQGRSYWVIKDPINLKYYRFESEEFAILQMLDGETSLESIQSRFEETYRPQKISVAELHRLVGMLYRSSLVVSDASGQGVQLRQRAVKTKRKQRLASLTNILSIRFKGWDPDALLNWMDARFGWFFSLPAFFACLLIVVAAALLLTSQMDTFLAKLPGFHEFFAVKNWLWLAIVLAITKILHEFGHGLSCKRFGGECHEMGVMFLVMTPCLYCNVSDSWMVPSKWKRATIGAAGMYVEIVLASVCTFIWWFTHPGWLNYTCLNIMFVSSVSTILFNANPLMRYDGYYICSDLLEIPNLRQKASTILRRKSAALFLGLPETDDPFLPQRNQIFFAIYSLAAAGYRWVVSLGIFWFLYQVFEPHGFKIVGQLIAMMALYGLLVQPLWQLGKFFCAPGRIDQVNKLRLQATLAGAVFVVLFFLLIPLPFSVNCSLLIQPRNAEPVYVEVAGDLEDLYVQPGQEVAKGQKIAKLANPALALQFADLKAQQQRVQMRWHSLLRRDLEGDVLAAGELNSVEQSLRGLQKQLSQVEEDLAKLTIRAPADGVVMKTADRPTPSQDALTLAGWSGSLFDRVNLGATLQPSDMICQIGDPKQMEAVMAIDQKEVEFVRPGQHVQIQPEQLPGFRFHSQVGQIAKVDMKYSPESMSAKSGGDLATRTNSDGKEIPVSATYQASSHIDAGDRELMIGGTGLAKIHAGYQTMAERTWRFACRTFKFEL